MFVTTQEVKMLMLPYDNMYDQRLWKARDPVCSPIDKPETARLVVGWVTTSESLVLYAFLFFSFLFFIITQELSRPRCIACTTKGSGERSLIWEYEG